MSDQILSSDFFRDEIFAIPGFAPRPSHAEIARKYGVPEVYRMSSNESVLGVSPKVVEAIREAAPTLGFYPPMTDHILRDALAQTLGRGLTRDHFFTGCSGYEALDLVLRAFLRPGDEVIISHPTFPVYDRLILLNNGIIVDVPLLAEHDYALDVDGILAAIN
ncbi:MAG TPA: aminotransferase class I/II-fold pyridoxal phosphate-dependent enzyme, partial [Aggregatilineales bacterium]|nr:aminotransferase class I/II-fold pyridoxal phosphate-dependent enzyme [Aggregatilineales bacterium]